MKVHARVSETAPAKGLESVSGFASDDQRAACRGAPGPHRLAALITIERLSYRYPGSASDALRELSMRVREGSLVGLLGPNGSGKTTLVTILAGILPAPADKIRVAGIDLARGVREVQVFSGLVPQEYAFYPRLTVLENLRFFAGVQRIGKSEIDGRIAEAVEITGLREARDRRAEHFSGGMKRRLNFAIGMLNRPRLLFLDEPTVGIDPHSRHFILEAVRRINRAGTTVIYTSHYMEEVEALCDEIGVLDDGKLLVQGPLSSLLASANGGHVLVNLAAPPNEAQRLSLARIPGLRAEAMRFEIDHCAPEDFQRLMSLLTANAMTTTRVKYGHGNLEELFLHLTRKQLRD
jgi:ABC-2 type transport system ATP-binding protein